MGKKILSTTAMMGCLVFCQGSGEAAALNEVVDAEKGLYQIWAIDSSAHNKVTFEGNGSIGETGNGEESGDGTAVSVEFCAKYIPEQGSVEYTAAEKKNSLLTVEFNNDAHVETAVDDPAKPTRKLLAHIYAVNTQPSSSAMGINLAEGVNLTIARGVHLASGGEGNNGYIAALVAYSNVPEGSSAAVAIGAMNTNRVEVNSPASLTASSSSSGSDSVSAGVGTASLNGNGTASALAVWFGDGNDLNVSSSAGSDSVSAGVGAASLNGNGTASIPNLWFGDSNNLNVSSFSSGSDSVSTGVGAASPNGDSIASIPNLRFGDSNDLTISSASSSYSASTGVGAAVANGTGSTASTTGLNVRFGDGNDLTISSASSSYSASTGVGTAVANTSGTSTANVVTVNMNGSQTLAAVAYSSGTATVNTFGANNTDKGAGDFGWRVGIFAAGQEIKKEDEVMAKALAQDSTVNILGAKLEDGWSIPSDNVAIARLGANQETSSGDYARAFALGEDFKIYIGGMVDPDTHEFTPVLANGKTNVVNVVGAISKGKSSTNTNESVFVIANGWSVNTYGPVRDLATVHIMNNSKWNVYGPTSDLPDIHVHDGVLHLTKDDVGHTNFSGVIGQIANKMTYVDPTTGTSYKGSEGKVNINAESYPWNGAPGGSLVLGANHRLVLSVDSSALAPSLAPSSEMFRLVRGYVAIDAGMANALTFNGGKIILVDDSEGSTDKTTNYWLIRSGANGSVENVAKLLGIGAEAFATNFTQVNEDLYRLIDAHVPTLFAPQPAASEESESPAPEESVSEQPVPSALASTYPWLTDNSVAYLFNDDADNISGLFIGDSIAPELPRPEPEIAIGGLGEFYVNVELASLTVAAHTLLSNAISHRLTRVKGRLADPFVHAVYGHSHQHKLAKWGYSNDMGGFVAGADNVWSLSDEQYLRLGAAFGYVHGKTNFSHSVVDVEKSAKHDIHMVELFGAYESFDDNQLKTNVGVTLSYGHGRDKLHRVNPGLGVFDGKIRSHNIFAGMEFVKNLYAYEGCQFGLWLRANYNHIAQKGHGETSLAPFGAQHVSAVDHNLFTTTLGLNVEREFFDPEHADERWLLSLKAGWKCQPVRKHSAATILVDNNFGIGAIVPAYGQPGKHAAIGILAVAKKLNDHWNIAGSYMGRLSGNISSHSLSCGILYSF